MQLLYQATNGLMIYKSNAYRVHHVGTTYEILMMHISVHDYLGDPMCQVGCTIDIFIVCGMK